MKLRFQMIWNVIVKEAMALFRNKRVLIGIFGPLLVMPALLWGYDAFSSKVDETAEETKSRIAIVSELPEALFTGLAAEDTLEIIENPPTDPKEQLMLSGEGTLDVVLSVVDGKYLLRYDFGRASAQRASARIHAVLDDYRSNLRLGLVTEAGGDPSILEAPKLVTEDMATATEAARRSVSGYIPAFIILYLMMTLSSFAIEMTTTEKETGTMETLMSLPISRMELLVGKLVACMLFGLLTLAVILGGFYVMLPLFGSGEIAQLNISGGLLAAVFVTLLPLLVLGAAMTIATGMMANSYKESSAYLTPVLFLFMIPAYIGTIPGLSLNGILSLVPILNATLLVKDAFLGQLDFAMFFTVFAINAIFALLSVGAMSKVFSTETLIFGSGKELSFRLKRDKLVPRDYLEAQDVLIVLSIAIVAFIYLSVVLPLVSTLEVTFYASQYGIFVGLPLLVLWYLKADLVKSLSLRLPRLSDLRYVLEGLVLWGAAYGISLLYGNWLSQYVGEAPTLVGLDEQLKAMPFMMQFVFLALTPGICEEFLMRGFALKPLERRFGGVAAVIMTAAIFALIHLDLFRLFPTFLLGLAFGTVTLRSKSIYPAMLLHMLNNGIALFMIQ